MNMRSSLILLLLVALLAACSARRTTQQKIPRIGHRETGIASWYGDPYHGRRAANGEVYDMEKLTAAHQTYAFDTWLRVVNLSNDKSVVVRITDRGPFVDHRIIDLSRAAAREIDMLRAGTTKVRLEVVDAPKTSEQHPRDDPRSTQQPTTGRFTLQAGAFREEANAQSLAERLRKIASTVAVVHDEQSSMWKVTVGRFQNAAEAGELASMLQSEGVDTFVVESTR
jgi:rare lipoprotein A